MYMFRSKRTQLTKRLVKAAAARRRRGGGGDEGRRAVEEASSAAATVSDGGGVTGLLKELNQNQLEMLCCAVESRGLHHQSNCVLLPRESDPHVLCCQTWRWPDLRQSAELRRLPACRTASDPVYICCNPFHWSRLCQPDSPPPPYSRCAMERLKPEDRAPSEVPIVCRDSYQGSLTTNGEESLNLNRHVWCKLAYWELSQRVGPLFPVEPVSLNIFGDIPPDIPNGDGLSLKTLAQHSFSPPEAVSRTRCKIGLGVTLAQEEDGIWIYNRSENPIFVNSSTLEDEESPSPTRVPPEHCLCVFDPVKAAHQNYGWNFTNCLGPVDKNSVRISFAKGWGPRYSRREITSCPCWIEVLLAPCR